MTATETDLRAFASTPADWFGHSWHAMHHVPAQELSDLQLAALPQDAIEPMRRMVKWIVDEQCSPDQVTPLWTDRSAT